MVLGDELPADRRRSVCDALRLLFARYEAVGDRDLAEQLALAGTELGDGNAARILAALRRNQGDLFAAERLLSGAATRGDRSAIVELCSLRVMAGDVTGAEHIALLAAEWIEPDAGTSDTRALAELAQVLDETRDTAGAERIARAAAALGDRSPLRLLALRRLGVGDVAGAERVADIAGEHDDDFARQLLSDRTPDACASGVGVPPRFDRLSNVPPRVPVLRRALQQWATSFDVVDPAVGGPGNARLAGIVGHHAGGWSYRRLADLCERTGVSAKADMVAGVSSHIDPNVGVALVRARLAAGDFERAERLLSEMIDRHGWRPLRALGPELTAAGRDSLERLLLRAVARARGRDRLEILGLTAQLWDDSGRFEASDRLIADTDSAAVADCARRREETGRPAAAERITRLGPISLRANGLRRLARLRARGGHYRESDRLLREAEAIGDAGATDELARMWADSGIAQSVELAEVAAFEDVVSWAESGSATAARLLAEVARRGDLRRRPAGERGSEAATPSSVASATGSGVAAPSESTAFECICCTQRSEPIGTDRNLCPMCFWQVDVVANIDTPSPVNSFQTLRDARRRYRDHGAVRDEFVHYTVPPYSKPAQVTGRSFFGPPRQAPWSVLPGVTVGWSTPGGDTEPPREGYLDVADLGLIGFSIRITEGERQIRVQRVGALGPGRVDQYELRFRYPDIDWNQPVLSGFDEDLTAAFRTIVASTASMGYRVAHTLTWRDLGDSQRWIAESPEAKDDACRREAFTKDPREQSGTTRPAEEFVRLAEAAVGLPLPSALALDETGVIAVSGSGSAAATFDAVRAIASQSSAAAIATPVTGWTAPDSIEFAIFLENNRGRAIVLLGTAVDGERSDDTAAVVDRWEVLEGIPLVWIANAPDSVQQP